MGEGARQLLEGNVLVVEVGGGHVVSDGAFLPAGEELHAIGHDIELALALAVFLPLVPPQAPVDE
jgi:hypothetical protein